ncbi:hypothetical protein BJX70DRAFT_386393 [Aspergillus crustosus]
MAAVTIAPYSHDAYHTVTKPSLHEAIKAFNAANAMHYINTVIRDCVIKHNVQQQFTACIKHRHFDLTPDQRNIEEEDGRAFGSSNLENITPCSWLFHEGKLYPYEFKRQAGEQPSGPPQAFVDELGAIVEKHGLCDKTDHEDRVSTTKSYAEGAPELQDPKNAVVASFAFF